MPPDTPLLTVIVQVLRHTPLWVWGVLAGLILLGGLQFRELRSPRRGVALMPLGLGMYSLWGAVSLFGLHAGVVTAWMLGAAGAALWSRRWPWAPGVGHDTGTDRFTVPGTPWPLLLMLTVFALRYGVVVTLVLHRDWPGHAMLAVGASAGYGVLSGLMAGRALYILSHGPRATALAAA
jgi:hypothetical protein